MLGGRNGEDAGPVFSARGGRGSVLRSCLMAQAVSVNGLLLDMTWTSAGRWFARAPVLRQMHAWQVSASDAPQHYGHDAVTSTEGFNPQETLYHAHEIRRLYYPPRVDRPNRSKGKSWRHSRPGSFRQTLAMHPPRLLRHTVRGSSGPGGRGVLYDFGRSFM